MNVKASAAAHEARTIDSELLRLVIESVRDCAIFMLDPNGFVASWNLGAERIKGYRPEEAIGMHFSRFYPAEAIEQGWPQHELEVARARGQVEDEGWRVRKDGTKFWANVVITAVRDRQGRLRGFAKVTRDMTERRHALALEASQQRVDEFFAMLGHELRNPLGVIQNAASLVEQHGTTDVVREAGTMLTRQVAYLARLVDDLLDVARVRSGKIALQERAIDLAQIVKQAVDCAAGLIASRGHRLDLQIAEDRLPMVGDATRLLQMTLNVLGNAAKYTRRGGNIQVKLVREPRHAVLSIRDDGVGIPAELLREIFLPFSQGHRSVDHAEGGLGIGLTLAQRIAELHGGSMEARSAGLDQGSVFIMRLPLASPDAAEETIPMKRTQPMQQKRHRVLIVDDNRDAADSLAMLLRIDGYSVEVAYEGTVAIASFQRQGADVVVLDIGLPGMDGYEVAKRLRALAGGARLTLIALTGYGQEKDRERALSSGFQHHLVKPVDYASLRNILA